ASVVRYRNSTACGSRSTGGVANNTALAIAMTAQTAQASSERCRSGLRLDPACRGDWLSACGAAGAVAWDALDGIAGAAFAAIPWKWPNASTNWIASAKSASRAPCLMFDRNHFMPRGTPHRPRPGDPGQRQCYNITSGNPRGCQPCPTGHRRNCAGLCNSGNAGGLQRDHRPSRSQVAAKAPSSSNSPIRPANSGSTPTPLTTLASRILTPIQPSPWNELVECTGTMRGISTFDPSTTRRASPPVACASGFSVSVVDVTSENSFGLVGPTLTRAFRVPS